MYSKPIYHLVNWFRCDLTPGVDHIFWGHRPAAAVLLVQFTGEAAVNGEGAEVVPANLGSLVEYLLLRLRSLKVKIQEFNTENLFKGLKLPILIT